jgi:Tfp pilus assembly protein PilE
MGQQQLLLLVLGAIIVGLAIVVGINLFGQGALKANEDSVRQDILSMMSRVEEYYRKHLCLEAVANLLMVLPHSPSWVTSTTRCRLNMCGLATAVTGTSYTITMALIP